jgi:uncharacterized protein (DUF3084 family)
MGSKRQSKKAGSASMACTRVRRRFDNGAPIMVPSAANMTARRTSMLSKAEVDSDMVGRRVYGLSRYLLRRDTSVRW